MTEPPVPAECGTGRLFAGKYDYAMEFAAALTLPFPPSANNYIRHTKGLHYPTKAAKLFRASVAAICREVCVQPIPGRLSVVLTLNPPNRIRRDIDNHCKPTLDALMHAGCFADDEAIDDIHIIRGPVVKPAGRCTVSVRVVKIVAVEPQQASLPVARELADEIGMGA